MLQTIQAISWYQSLLNRWSTKLYGYSASTVILFLLLLRLFSEELFESISRLILAIGFVFPGMIHGALDFHLIKLHSGGNNPKVLLLMYILSIALVLIAWIFFPILIFALFLFVSAYHFGATDLKAAKTANGLVSGLYGILLLSFIFITHLKETTSYLERFGIIGITISTAVSTPLLISTAVSLFFIGYHNLKRNQAVNTALVLMLGCYLPLLVAFGIYYLFVHSLTAWRDLHVDLSMDYPTMVRLGLPYTLGGCAVICSAFFFLNSFSVFTLQPVVMMSAGVAAITFPHAITMAIHYYHSKSTS